MNIKYSIIQMVIPQHSDKPVKFYAKAHIREEASPDRIANKMAYNNTMTDGDVLNLLSGLIRICFYPTRMLKKVLLKDNFKRIISAITYKKAIYRKVVKAVQIPELRQTHPHKLDNLTAYVC